MKSNHTKIPIIWNPITKNIDPHHTTTPDGLNETLKNETLKNHNHKQHDKNKFIPQLQLHDRNYYEKTLCTQRKNCQTQKQKHNQQKHVFILQHTPPHDTIKTHNNTTPKNKNKNRD